MIKIMIALIVILYLSPAYTMNGPIDENSKIMLSLSFYNTKANIESLKSMIAHNIDLNLQDTYGDTPLHLALLKKSPEYISILLAAGANPNKTNYENKSPLHYAITQQQLDSILLLLQAKANPNLKNKFGNTPLHLVTFWPAIPDKIKIAQLLLQYGGQVDIVNNIYLAPLQLLVTNYAGSFSSVTRSIARTIGRLLVWYQYILLPHFLKQVPEKEHAWAIASHVALVCAEQPTIWP